MHRNYESRFYSIGDSHHLCQSDGVDIQSSANHSQLLYVIVTIFDIPQHLENGDEEAENDGGSYLVNWAILQRDSGVEILRERVSKSDGSEYVLGYRIRMVCTVVYGCF